MLLRNTSGYTKDLPTLDPPQRVPPGGEIEHDGPIAGFTPVTELGTGNTRPVDGQARGDKK